MYRILSLISNATLSRGVKELQEVQRNAPFRCAMLRISNGFFRILSEGGSAGLKELLLAALL
jgi:hypothetical protein